ncbi:MAG TPA: ferritin-like domain-containing protein [Polyangiales bacterium]
MKEHDKNDDKKSARRELIGSGALAAAGALLAGFAAACGDDDDEKPITQDGGVDGGVNHMDASIDASHPADAGTVDADVAVLNALLTAEYNAIIAYSAAGQFVTGAKNTDPLYDLRNLIAAVAGNILSHHQLHAAALVSAVHALGGTAVTQAEVMNKFAPPPALLANASLSNILKFAAGAERAAAVAYNKAIGSLEAAKHRYLATAIEGDEAQHFIVLAALVLGLATPGPNLTVDKAGTVVPRAFVRTVGDQPGLDVAPPPNYFT